MPLFHCKKSILGHHTIYSMYVYVSSLEIFLAGSLEFIGSLGPCHKGIKMIGLANLGGHQCQPNK